MMTKVKVKNTALSNAIRLKVPVPPFQFEGVYRHPNKRFLGFGQGSLYKDVMEARRFVAENKNDKPFADRELPSGTGAMASLVEKIKAKADGEVEKARKETQGITRNKSDKEAFEAELESFRNRITLETIVELCAVRPAEWLKMQTIEGVDETVEDRRFFESLAVIPPVEAPTVGSILSEVGTLENPGKRFHGIRTAMEPRTNPITGEEMEFDVDDSERGELGICIVESVEAYIVALALLRECDFEANLAFGYDTSNLHEQGVVQTTLLAITSDDKEFPVGTVYLGEPHPGYVTTHPGLTQLELISDQGVYGITLGLKAKIMARKIVSDVAQRTLDGDENALDEGMLENQAHELAELLCRADDIWHLSPWVVDNIKELYNGFHMLIDTISDTDKPIAENMKEARGLAKKVVDMVVERIKEIGKDRDDDDNGKFTTLGNVCEDFANGYHEMARDLDEEIIRRQVRAALGQQDEMMAAAAMLRQMQREMGE